MGLDYTKFAVSVVLPRLNSFFLISKICIEKLTLFQKIKNSMFDTELDLR